MAGDLYFYCGKCCTVESLLRQVPGPYFVARVERDDRLRFYVENHGCDHVIDFCESATCDESWGLYRAAELDADLTQRQTVFDFRVVGGRWDDQRWVVWPL